MHLTSSGSTSASFLFVGESGTDVSVSRVAARLGARVRVFSLERCRRGFDWAAGEPLVIGGQADQNDPVELVREARASHATIPILFLAEDIATVPAALAAGATDFILTTASPQELAIRLRLLLDAAARERSTERRVGGLRLDRETRRLYAGAHSVQLTPIEMQVFECLAAHVGEAVPRAELERSIWGCTDDQRQTSNVAVVYVSYLRGKLAKLGGACWVSTFPRLGYALELKDVVERRARAGRTL